MNSSVLQFTLGLGTGNFLHALGDAKGKVVGFIGSVAGFGAIMEGVFSAIEKGAALEHLSKRTTTAVSDLFQLQKGFKAAGVDVDSLGNTLFQMQKALGGVNEQGEDTKSIFYKMGLSVDDLKKMNAPEQINTILKSLDSLGTSEAAKAASSIFGRMNAQNIVQLTNSSEEFGAAMKAAANDAKNWERIAPLFEKVELAMQKIKSIGSNLFAGIAEGFAPIILSGLKYLESWRDTLSNIGQMAGNIIKVITQAIREGKLDELIGSAFEAGAERLGNILFNPSLWYGFSEMILGAFGVAEGGIMKIFVNLGTFLESVLDKAWQETFVALGKIPGIGKMLGLENTTAKTFSDIYKDNSKTREPVNKWIDQFTGGGKGMFKEGMAEFSKAIAESKGGPAQQKFDDLINGLLSRSPALPGSKEFKKSGDSLETSNHYKPEFTAFEKMGFVMGGAGNPLLAPTQRTAHNTDRMAHALERLVGAGAGNQENKV